MLGASLFLSRRLPLQVGTVFLGPSILQLSLPSEESGLAEEGKVTPSQPRQLLSSVCVLSH